jgi:hypothetical protein
MMNEAIAMAVACVMGILGCGGRTEPIPEQATNATEPCDTSGGTGNGAPAGGKKPGTTSGTVCTPSDAGAAADSGALRELAP